MFLQKKILNKKVSSHILKNNFFKKIKEKTFFEDLKNKAFNYYNYYNLNESLNLNTNIDFVKRCKEHFLQNYDFDKNHLIYTNSIVLAKELTSKKNIFILNPLNLFLFNKDLFVDSFFINESIIFNLIGFKHLFKIELENLMLMFLSDKLLSLDFCEIISSVEEIKNDFEEKNNIKLSNYLLL